MKKFTFLLMFVLAVSCYAQNFVFPYPMIQKPGFWADRNVATLTDSTTSAQSFDYLFIDTTGHSVRTTFAGSPVTFVFEPTLTSGTESDSLLITILPLVYYDSVADSFYTASYDNAGTDLKKTVCPYTFDWTSATKYVYPLALDYPLWGIRISITYVSLSSNGYLYHHIIIQ